MLQKKEVVRLYFRERPRRPVGRPKLKAGAIDPQGSGTAPAGQRRRTRKAAELFDDPIDPYDEESQYLEFPDDIDGTAPVAGPSNARAVPQPSANMFTLYDDDGDDDDEVQVLDFPPPLSPEHVMKQCYEALKKRRNVVSPSCTSLELYFTHADRV